MKHVALVLIVLAAQDPKPAQVTFTRHVAPIVFANCASCHREGEVGPFPLVAYGDVKKRAKQIVDVVASRRMPPWKPVEGHGEFVGERRMKAADIELLKAWVEQGCAEGEAGDLPPFPKFPEGWAFGEPDLIVSMPETYTVPAEGRDIVRAFAVPLGLTEDKYVRALQFRPGNPRVVHHALLLVDATSDSRQKDAADPEPGFDARRVGFGALSGGSLGTWFSGALSQPYPDGMGKEIKKNADLVLQIHFNPIGRKVQEKSQVGLWFWKEKPARLIVAVPLFNSAIDLPPGEKDLRIKDKYQLPVDVDLVGVVPHAHFLAKECRVWAKDPDGKEMPLLWIKDWDFDWQEQYRYKQAIRLVRGTELNMIWTYDNTSSNPRNPSNPPVRVKSGEHSTDEMALAGMQFAISNPGDRMKLYTALLFKPQEK